MNEFDIISKYFATNVLTKDNSIAIIGDDAAVVDIPKNQQIVQSLDTLVADVHFPRKAPAYAIGYRALAVCISDLAAMGAKPHSFLLALTLPSININWLAEFSRGLASCAQENDIALIGGDTTSGPLCISIQVQGLLSTGNALLRSGSKVGDIICVTGNLGNGAAALQYLNETNINNQYSNQAIATLLQSYWYPKSQISVAQHLQAIGATSAIDISDGLLQDLHHMLAASKTGAQLELSTIPLSAQLTELVTNEKALEFALTGGDDYMLIVTVPASKRQQLIELTLVYPQITPIGIITDSYGIIKDENNNQLEPKGYKHFN